LNEFVASCVPVRARTRKDRPASAGRIPLTTGPRPAGRRPCSGTRRRPRPPLDEPRNEDFNLSTAESTTVLDPARVIAAAGHRHHGGRRGGHLEAVPDGAGGPRP
jgi:hypothetical protein